MAIEDRVIVALDVDCLLTAVHLVTALKEQFSAFKLLVYLQAALEA